MADTSPLRRRMIEDMKVRNLSPRTQRCWCTRWPNSPSTSIDRLTGWGWRKFAPIKSTSTQLGQVQRRGLRSPLLLRRHPQAHRDEPALGQQFLDIAVAQGEPEIEPDRVLDDLGREPMAAIAEQGHADILPYSAHLTPFP